MRRARSRVVASLRALTRAPALGSSVSARHFHQAAEEVACLNASAVLSSAKSASRVSDKVDHLCSLVQLSPSAHDERLHALVEEIASQRHDLSLTNLVRVINVLQSFGLHESLDSLAGLVTDSASFLSSDVILGFAKALSITSHHARSGNLEVRAAVFRILGDHINESMFDSSPPDLAEALLAISVFCCGGRGGGPDTVLSKPWYPTVFHSAATVLSGRVDELDPQTVVKLLRAYSLFMTAHKASTIDSAPPHHTVVDTLPNNLAATLARCLPQVPARSVVRSLYALVCLHESGVSLSEQGVGFYNAAAAEIGDRRRELRVRDIAYTLRALALLHRRGIFSGPKNAELLGQLYQEMQHHVPSMTLDDTLMMTRAAAALVPLRSSGEVRGLLAAELMRDVRALRPQQLTDAVASLCQLRLENPEFFHRLSGRFMELLPDFPPRHLAVVLGSLVKVGKAEWRVFDEAGHQIVRRMLAFEPRDIALSLWAFSKVSYRHPGLFGAVQQTLKLQGVSHLTPKDMSMLLWSFSRVEWDLDETVLSSLTHHIARGSSHFSSEALLVSCLAFARLGFAQQPVLVELYRSLYAQLPQLNQSQLSFVFFLFSASGVRDEPLLNRLLFESNRRLPELRGQDLSNVVLACSRVATPASVLGRHGFGEALRKQVFEELDKLERVPLLGIYMAAPQVFSWSKDESLLAMETLSKQLSRMDAAELAKCLLATSRLEIMHKPFLLPLFHRLGKASVDLGAADTVSCIWSLYLLGFCKPKLQRSLGSALRDHVRNRRLPARTLRDVLPALSHFGFWQQLPGSLQRSVWRLAGDDLRRCAAAPEPSARPAMPIPHGAQPGTDWRLSALKRGMFRRQKPQRVLSQAHRLESIGTDLGEESSRERKEEQELAESKEDGGERTPIGDFVDMVRRL